MGTRILASYDYADNNGLLVKQTYGNGHTVNYTYDADGLRTGRTDGTNTYQYIYAGDKLVRMIYNGEVVDISYAGSQPLSLTYDGATYYYVLNGQGDVIGLTNSSGKMVIGYTFGAYGVATGLVADPELSYVLVQMNPLTYRGYVYDRETKFFYLQSRYYDPELGRFINADAYASTGQGVLGNNMFAYCLNNPVCMVDADGKDAIYVVDTSAEEGLPVVGHAFVYIQDSDGNWYKTEYAGVFPDKSTAHVRTMLVSVDEINQIKNGEAGIYILAAYITGDFSKSVDKAVLYAGSNYSGYDLLTNNCMHYAKEILLAGDFDSQRVRNSISNSINPIPMELLFEISSALISDLIWRAFSNGAENLWNYVTESFD